MWIIDAIQAEMAHLERLLSLTADDETITADDLLMEKPENGEPMPEGTLITRQIRGSTYCYIARRDGSKRRNIYIGKPESDRAQAAKAYRFRKERRRILKHDLKALREVLSRLIPLETEHVEKLLPEGYGRVRLDPHRTAPADPLFQRCVEWAKASYEHNPAPMPEQTVLAIDGRQMRSKGECLIYNILYLLGIPFRYDLVLRLQDENGNVVVRCPDFMIRCLSGRYIVIEHLGMLDSLKYRVDFAERTYLYMLNDFVLGDNYFVTSDEKNHGTNTAAIHTLIQVIRSKFYDVPQGSVLPLS